MSFLYPPILPSTYPAFLATDTDLTIPYSFSKMMDDSEVRHIDIVISRQRDNFNLVSKVNYPDGIVYQEYQSNVRTVTIPITDLTEPWQTGEIYKIQVRFGKGELWDGFPDITTGWATWKTEQINEGNFGEWSNVLLVKAITEPNVHQPYTLNETELLPTFYGSCESDDGENSYQFIVKQGSEIVEESNWLKHTDYIDLWQLNTPLDNGIEYTIIYQIITINGYVAQNSYTYTPYSSDIAKLEHITINAAPNHEEGYIEVIVTSTEPLIGNYILSRSEDNIHWEDMRYFLCSEATTITYRDYCIESGVRYCYGFQYENSFHYRTTRNILEHPECCYFEHCYLYANGVQLKLEFDNKISSFKHTTLTSKQDTLGSKYPTISRNGNAYYGEFSLSGLISYHMNSESFFTIGKDGLYYRNELVLRRRENFPTEEDDRNYHTKGITVTKKFDHKTYYTNYGVEYALTTDVIASGGYRNTTPPEEEEINSGEELPAIFSYYSYDIDTNPSQPNIYIERKFREKVEEFLNDGNYKLFKSPTESTMIVALTNVQLQPNDTLHRLISNFSSTVYEVADFNRKNLEQFGLDKVGEWKDITNADYVQKIGAIEINTPPINVIANIRSILASEDKIFHRLLSFSIESDDVSPLTLITNSGEQLMFATPNTTYYVDESTTEIQVNSIMTFNYVCDYNVEEDPRQLKRIFSYSGTSNYTVAQSSSPWEVMGIITDEKIGEKLLRAETEDSTITRIKPGYYENDNKTLEFYEINKGIEWIEFSELTPTISMTITINESVIHYVPAAAHTTMRFYPIRDNITAIVFDNEPVNIDMTVKMNFIGREYEVS